HFPDNASTFFNFFQKNILFVLLAQFLPFFPILTLIRRHRSFRKTPLRKNPPFRQPSVVVLCSCLRISLSLQLFRKGGFVSGMQFPVKYKNQFWRFNSGSEKSHLPEDCPSS